MLVLALAAQAITLIPASAQLAITHSGRIQLSQGPTQPGAPFVDEVVLAASTTIPNPLPALAAVLPPPPPPPPPKPRPVTVPASKAALADIIRAAAARYGVDPERLLRVAWCESSLNPNAVSVHGAEGLFQFKPPTYRAHGGKDIWDPAEQADVAAKMFSQGLAYEWICR